MLHFFDSLSGIAKVVSHHFFLDQIRLYSNEEWKTLSPSMRQKLAQDRLGLILFIIIFFPALPLVGILIDRFMKGVHLSSAH
jgi:hypothetical protein